MTATASTDEAPAAPTGKRARFIAATGLPAVLVAGGVILPTMAHAAPATTGSCPAGTTQKAIKQAPVQPTSSAAPGTTQPSSPSLPSAPASSGASVKQPGAPVPTGSQPSVPAPSSGSTTPAPSQPTSTGTSAPSVPAPSGSPTSVPSSAPSSAVPAPTTATSSPSSGVTWWDPLTWFNSTTPSAQIFNPQPQSGAGTRNAAVNQLGSAKVANPAVVAALATSAPATPTTPTTPKATPTTSKSTAKTTAPTVSTTPSTPSSSSSSPSAPTTSASAPSSVCVATTKLNPTNETLWHLHATSLTLYGMTYNGVVTIPTAKGPVNVLDFTADAVDVVSMTTWSTNPASGKNDYANGGQGKTVALTQVHLHVLQQTGDLAIPILGIPVGPVTLAPGSAFTDALTLFQGVQLPIPVTFTGVDVDQYLLTAKTLDIPGFLATQQQ